MIIAVLGAGTIVRVAYSTASISEPDVIQHTYGNKFTLGKPAGSMSAAQRGHQARRTECADPKQFSR